MKSAQELEQQAVLQVAALMAAAARTAPKTRGLDNIRVAVIDDEPARQRLITTMQEIGQKEQRPGLVRDAGNIAAAPAIVVIGVAANPAKLDCGFCGHVKCDGLVASGGICAFNSIDLGIAVTSALVVASQFHIDNRLMYSIGRACLDLQLLGADVKQALGIPLSVTGKNPFFDRKP
jgi:uncharacterized ferredoxin-like protein